MTVAFALLLVLGSIGVIVALVGWVRLEPLLVLFGVSLAVALVVGRHAVDGVQSFETGAGRALGHLGFVIAFGSMLGRIVAESGAIDRIAETIVYRAGPRRLHWAMGAIGLVVGLPVFFDVGFVLLAPLAYVAAQRSGKSLLLAALPLAASLSIVHALLPPHPAIMIAVQFYGASVGRTILYGAALAVPTAILAGPLFTRWIVPRLEVRGESSLGALLAKGGATEGAGEGGRSRVDEAPSFGLSLVVMLMPVLLILDGVLLQTIGSRNGWAFQLGAFIGNTDVALFLAVLFAWAVLGARRGMSRDRVVRVMHASLAPMAFVILLVGAGAGFGRALIDTGVSGPLTVFATRLHVSLLLMGWSLAAVVRLATGSATVAMSTAASLIAPVFHHVGGVPPELMVLATGAGSVAFGPVTDATFWQIKEYLGMSVGQTVATWSSIETIISLVVLGGTCLFAEL